MLELIAGGVFLLILIIQVYLLLQLNNDSGTGGNTDALAQTMQVIDERQMRLKEESIRMERSLKQMSTTIKGFSESQDKLLKFIEDGKQERDEIIRTAHKTVTELNNQQKSFKELGDLVRITCSISQGFGGSLIDESANDTPPAGGGPPSKGKSFDKGGSRGGGKPSGNSGGPRSNAGKGGPPSRGGAGKGRPPQNNRAPQAKPGRPQPPPINQLD